MKLPFWIVALCAAAVPVAAKADTFQLFQVNATLTGGGAVTGTVNLDLSNATARNPYVSTADLQIVTGGSTYSLTGYNNGFGWSVAARPSYVEFDFGRSQTGAFLLNLPIDLSGLSSYAGGALCSTSVPCYRNSGFNLSGSSTGVTSGTLTAVAATPEPGSIVLLATGLLAVGGVVRRRMA